MKIRSTSTRPLRTDIVQGLATLRKDPALFRMKLRQRWERRKRQDEPPQGSPRPRVASIDQDLTTVLAELRRESVRTAIVYGDEEFRQALTESATDIAWDWVSHRDIDVLAGALLPGESDVSNHDAVVVGGADVKTAYLNALRWLERSGTVRPLFWVGTNFEFCGSTIPIPAEVESADIYLFHHFADYFPIKDPLLVRVTSSDHRNRRERLIIMRPQQTVHFTLDDLLPDRDGTAVIEVRTTHPALTGNRHPRWRVWVDLFWKGSLTSLHGAHDYGPDHVCESRIPLNECRTGSIVLTVPNYDHRASGSAADVRWSRNGHKGTFSPNTSLAVDQLNVSTSSRGDEQAPLWGYSYQGYGTSYWFAFDEDAGHARPSLCGNHEVTVAQIENRPHLSPERRALLGRLEQRGFLLWPHALPILDPTSDIELGFSFEWANPQVHDFEAVAFDQDGHQIGRRNVTLTPPGYHYADEILGALGLTDRPGLVLISPDWKKMGVDPQRINAFGNLAVRNKQTADRDITEFQSCWRNLNATVDGFPHWLHPSKGVVGRTSVVGHVRRRRGLRTGILVANAAGNLGHTARATVRLRLHSAAGSVKTNSVELNAFTTRLLWVDDLFDDLAGFLGDEGFGTCLVSCADADVNCQILTCSADGAVSLQHLWGY
jgi:hypothetical protein